MLDLFGDFNLNSITIHLQILADSFVSDTIYQFLTSVKGDTRSETQLLKA